MANGSAVTGVDLEEILGAEIAEDLEPRSEAELADAVKERTSRGQAVVAAGAATKLGWGGSLEPESAVLVHTTRLNGVTDHDPANLTVSVQAGIRYSDLQELLRRDGQWLPLDSPWGTEATIGGIVATGASGPKRCGYGAPRDLVLGVRAVLADGSRVHFGGKTVKNVAGYDVSKLFVGSLGTLGVLTEVTFRLLPLPPDERTILASFAEHDSLEQAVAAVLRSVDPVVAVEVVDRRGTDLLGDQADVPDGGTLLALRLQGTTPVLDRAVERLTSQIRSGTDGKTVTVEVRKREDSELFWRAYEETLFSHWQENGVVLKLRSPVRNAVAVLGALQALDHNAGWTSAGTGVGFLRLDAAPEALADGVRRVREILSAFRAQADVLVASPEGKARLKEAGVPLWAIPETRLVYMRKVKKVFDPGNLLAPGRFGGGI